jgi:hypothetical protein
MPVSHLARGSRLGSEAHGQLAVPRDGEQSIPSPYQRFKRRVWFRPRGRTRTSPRQAAGVGDDDLVGGGSLRPAADRHSSRAVVFDLDPGAVSPVLRGSGGRGAFCDDPFEAYASCRVIEAFIDGEGARQLGELEWKLFSELGE